MTDRPVALVLRCDADRCRETAKELRACGFETIEQTSIEAGLALLAGPAVDAAFCDACEIDSGKRPVWQRVLGATSRRDTVVVLLGRANSHQEMLAACPDSRLILCPPGDAEIVSERARELLHRSGLVAARHDAEAVDAPHFAERRLAATAEAL